MNYESIEEIENSLAKLIAAGKLKNKEIVVFGAPDSAEVSHAYLQKAGLMVSAVVNNNPSLQGTLLGSPPVCVVSPGSLFSNGVHSYAVLIASRHYAGMLKQLLGYGFIENKNVFQIADYRYHNSNDLSMKSFCYYLSRVYKGWKLKRQVFSQLKLGGDGKLYVLGYHALGDTYVICSYLKGHAQQNNITEWALVFHDSTAIQHIVKMFDVPKSLALSHDHRLMLLAYAQFCGAASNIEFICSSKNRVNQLSKLLGVNKVNMADLFRQAFQLQGDAVKPKTLQWKPGNASAIQQGLTVILFPYAYSTPLIDHKLWALIIMKLKGFGYTVLTNVARKNEVPLDGTQPIYIPIDSLISTAEYAGGVIMNRSGVSDVLSSAKCKKTIIYPFLDRKSDKYHGSEYIDMFGLQGMGLCDDAVEIQLGEEEDPKNIADEAVTQFKRVCV